MDLGIHDILNKSQEKTLRIVGLELDFTVKTLKWGGMRCQLKLSIKMLKREG